jgi:predicted XRE-type DNA-binding protein
MAEKKTARRWPAVRKDLAEAGLLDEKRVENARKDMTEEVRAYRLAEVRRSQHVRQVDVAGQMDVSQARVSKIEKGDLSRTELGTLESYVRALGGKLRVVADFGDESLTVC